MPIAYDLAYTLAAAAASPILAYRMLTTGKWRTDWPGRFGQCRLKPAGAPGKTILVHAVSVGEVNSIRLLVQKLSDGPGDLRIIVSSTTDTGVARARQLFEPKHAVVRFPLDWTCCVDRFLHQVKPNLVALVENEVWPNFVSQCQRHCIAVCVVNGRLTERSFKRYKLVESVARSMYGKLSAAAVQTQAYATRFRALGTPAQQVHILDTMKWDTAQVADHVEGAEALARALGIDRTRPLIVAGSTGPGEELLLLETCPRWAQLLVAPRKPERFNEVAHLGKWVRRTEQPDTADAPPNGQRLFLLDTIGELRKAYALADVVVVGRSFLGLHGSDMIEPIALGKPTVTGPHHSNFAETVTALQSARGLLVSGEPGQAVSALLADPTSAAQLAKRGRQVILQRQGSTDRHVAMLTDLLETVSRSN